jgi:hypothetical protein
LPACPDFFVSFHFAASCPQPGNWTLYQVNTNPLIAFDHWDCYSLNNSTGNWSNTPIPNITDTITLPRGSSMACVAQYIVLPPVPRLALLARLPDAYTGSTPRLQAVNLNSSVLVCEKNTTRWAPPNATVTSPGDGWCGSGTPPNGTVPAGSYSVNATAPVGTVFSRWECYNVLTGNATAINVTAAAMNSAIFSLPLGSAVTCVAVYDILPRLALLAQLPSSYTGSATPDLAAALPTSDGSQTLVCTKSPSARIGGNTSITTPGTAGLCNTAGTVAAGNYSLGHTMVPPGTVFSRWECYSISGSNSTQLNMSTPSNVDLQLNAVVTCVAVYQMLPQLSLLSQVNAPVGFPYVGSGGNLTAVGPSSSSCNKAQSSLVSSTVNATSPGAGAQCGASASAVGQYNLTQQAPAGTTFVRWECYNVTGGTAGVPALGPSVNIVLNEMWTCIASEW